MLQNKSTKIILAESLIELSKKMPIEKITVSAIVKNCGAGRQTFYNHFKDKYDLINWIWVTESDKIIKKYVFKEPWGIVLGRILSFIRDYYRFFKNAINQEGQFSFFNISYEYSINYYMDFLKANYGEIILTDELIFDIKFNCYGAISMLKEWLKSDMYEKPEIIGKCIANAMPQSLKRYFELNKDKSQII